MTKQLKLAFTEASKLPPEEQNILAEWLLAELSSEKEKHKNWIRRRFEFKNYKQFPGYACDLASSDSALTSEQNSCMLCNSN